MSLACSQSVGTRGLSLVRLKFVPRCVTRLKVGTRFVTRTYQNRYLDCHSSHGTQVCHSYIWNLYWFATRPMVHRFVTRTSGICTGLSDYPRRYLRYRFVTRRPISVPDLSLVPRRYQIVTRPTSAFYLSIFPTSISPLVPKGTRFVTRPTSARDFSFVPHGIWFVTRPEFHISLVTRNRTSVPDLSLVSHRYQICHSPHIDVSFVTRSTSVLGLSLAPNRYLNCQLSHISTRFVTSLISRCLICHSTHIGTWSVCRPKSQQVEEGEQVESGLRTVDSVVPAADTPQHFLHAVRLKQLWTQSRLNVCFVTRVPIIKMVSDLKWNCQKKAVMLCLFQHGGISKSIFIIFHYFDWPYIEWLLENIFIKWETQRDKRRMDRWTFLMSHFALLNSLHREGTTTTTTTTTTTSENRAH